ncbi:MAG: ABC transporter ATP-binding protein, partial [Phycisphaerales bacterium]
LRKQLFDHLQRMSLRFYRSNQPGRVSARVMDDTYKIQAFIQEKLPLLMLNLLKFQILIVVICLMNIRLALASIIILPLQFVTYRFFRAPIKVSHSEAQENLSLAYGSIVEKFLGIEVVKGFSAEARESATFHDAIDESRKSQIRSQRFHFAQKVTADLLVGLGTILLLAYGAFEVIKGRMRGGEFMMFFGYVMMLYPSVLEIISGVGHSSKATASVSRVFDMLDEPVHDEGVLRDDTLDHASETLRGEIQFDRVVFAYDDATEVLREISFTIRPGERVAITGPSGSGKSTAINLIPRFLTPSEGKITIGGVDTEAMPLKTLRTAIGIAFQEVFLFNATIYENLRYAREDATKAEVERVCKISGAYEVIQRLPRGFETRLSDFGVELSRGEKQRITLARALLKNSPILILDEATASIDRESSNQIIQTVFEEMPNRTILMVTHEATLMSLVDRVICIRDGQICFDGPPSRYMAQEYGGPDGFFTPEEPAGRSQTYPDAKSLENPAKMGDSPGQTGAPQDPASGYIEHRDDAHRRRLAEETKKKHRPAIEQAKKETGEG